MRLFGLVFLMFLCLVAAGQQTIVRDGVVRDAQLHFSLRLPPTFKVFDVNAIARNLGREATRKNEFLVFSAKAPDGPYGLVLLAERLGTDRKPALTKPDDFLDALVRSDASGAYRDMRRSHGYTEGKVGFARMDWRTDDGGYSSGIVLQDGGYLLCFKFNARSGSELGQMTETIRSFRITP